MTYRSFVAFSGGGAKGLVHVGALQALEDRGVQFAGVAGTSAGAIVATLAATGFNISETARRLGMHRRTLARKLEKQRVK